LIGNVISARARLNGLSHTWPDDVDVLLVGPAGDKTILMSDSGGSGDVTGLSLVFDDNAGAFLPDGPTLVSGTFKPTNHPGADTDAFSDPAPVGPHPTTLSVFRAKPANGTWNLYVKDSFVGDLGSIDGGWDLMLETTTGSGCPTINVDANVAASTLSLASRCQSAAHRRVQHHQLVDASGIRRHVPLCFTGSSALRLGHGSDRHLRLRFAHKLSRFRPGNAAAEFVGAGHGAVHADYGRH
jgi:subtilisin-like proprotein convertase family protein